MIMQRRMKQGQTFAPPPSPKPHKTHTHTAVPSLSLTFAPPNPLLFFCCCIPRLPCSNISLIGVALHANVWKDGALDAPTSKLVLGWRFDLAISTASLSLLHPQFCGVLAAFRCGCEGRIQPAQRAEAVAGPPRRRSKRLGCRLLGLECRGERVWSAGASAWSTLLCAEVNFDDVLWLLQGDMATIMQDASSLAKMKEASRTWMLLDTKGESTLLEVDKYAIMHRVGIHARDLRILDPLLSYPSTILGRERAIVLNLEHIKAIITADEVLLRNPTDESVIPFVEELCRRLPLKANKNEGVGIEVDEDEIKDFKNDGNGVSWSLQRGDQDENVPGADASPFEFRALEVALEAICSFLDARTTELETAAYPALDELTKKISSRNLDRVRKLKSGMTRLNARVQKVRDELEQLLDDDDDMADLFLTRKMLGPQSPGASSGALVWAPPSPTIVSRNSRTSKANTVTSFAHGTATGADDVEELEMLLEAYFMQIDGTLNKLTTLREYIDDTEDYINIQLDNHRNQLIQLELILSSATVVVALYSLVAGIFGMNLPYSWNHDHSYVFKWVVLVTGTVCTTIFGTVLGYARYKHLIGT